MLDSFVAWKDWWTEKYRFQIGEGVRYPSMKIALNLLHQRGGNIIVETGTTRAVNDFSGGGMATIFLGDYCKKYDKNLWTVDILPRAIELSQFLTGEFVDNITYVIDDSIHFLKELKAAEDKLTDQSIIILDDNAWKDGGKCKLTKEYLIEKGWTCLWDDY